MSAVLFVDDEPMILKSIERSLRAEPYQKFYAHSGEEALEVLEANVIDVLVTDMRMPGMKGLDLLKTAKEYYPNMVRIVLSGYTQVNQMIVTINQGDIFRFVPKPWDADTELKPAIQDALDYAAFLANKQTDTERLSMRNQLYQNVLTRFETKKKRLLENIETLKLAHESALSEMEALIEDYRKLMNEGRVESLQHTFNLQRRLHALMPLRSVKMDYDLASALIREAIDHLDLPIKPTFSKHTSRKPRVYGTVDLLPPVLVCLLEMAQEDNSISALHFEVSGDIDELIEHPDLPPLYLSVLVDIHLSKSDLDERFLKQFEMLTLWLEPYLHMRYAFKEGRLVIQIKMDLERFV